MENPAPQPPLPSTSLLASLQPLDLRERGLEQRQNASEDPNSLGNSGFLWQLGGNELKQHRREIISWKFHPQANEIYVNIHIPTPGEELFRKKTLHYGHGYPNNQCYWSLESVSIIFAGDFTLNYNTPVYKMSYCLQTEVSWFLFVCFFSVVVIYFF